MAKRIGYIVHTFPRLTLTFVLREILALEKMGLEVVVFSLGRPYDTTEHSEFQQMLAPIVYVPGWKRSPKTVISLGLKIFRLIKYPRRFLHSIPFLVKHGSKKLWYDFFRAEWVATRAQELHVSHFHAHSAATEASIAMFAAIISGKPYSFTAHASDIFPRQEYIPKKLDEATFVVAISEYNRNFLISLHPDKTISSKIYVVHCGVDLERIPNPLSLPQPTPENFTLITTARLVEYKGHHILVDALSILKSYGYQFSWIIVGSGPQRDIVEEMINVNELTKLVHFKGDQSSDAVIDLLKQSHLFVLPCVKTKDNRMDGIPVALMEAMAIGVPVISTTISGIPELIEHNVSGLLVPPEDAKALAEVLEQVIKDPTQLQRFRNPARKKIEEEFSVDKNAEILYQLFLNCST